MTDENTISIEEQLTQVSGNTDTKGDRYYAREFKALYTKVRKSLVLIAQARNKTIDNEKAYNLALKVLRENCNLEE